MNNIPCNNGNSNITDTNKDRNKDKDEGNDTRKEALETKDVMKSCWNKLISKAQPVHHNLEEIFDQ